MNRRFIPHGTTQPIKRITISHRDIGSFAISPTGAWQRIYSFPFVNKIERYVEYVAWSVRISDDAASGAYYDFTTRSKLEIETIHDIANQIVNQSLVVHGSIQRINRPVKIDFEDNLEVEISGNIDLSVPFTSPCDFEVLLNVGLIETAAPLNDVF